MMVLSLSYATTAPLLGSPESMHNNHLVDNLRVPIL
jgi:hypothetical protein